MKDFFDQDPFPTKPKILFIGLAQSTHTHSWIDLIADESFNFRLFSLPSGLPPEDWPIKTYITKTVTGQNTGTRRYLYSGIWAKPIMFFDKIAKWSKQRYVKSPACFLVEVIQTWKPDFIHTLGLFDDQGGLFYYEICEQFKLQEIGKWIVQIRGGSDLTLRRHNPVMIPVIQNMLNNCYQIISDNTENIRFAQELGISHEKFSSIVPVPGTGGVDIGKLSQNTLSPSKRERIILWPKAYESQWSKALPVLEAIQLAWDKIQPCEIFLLATSPDVYEWFLALPEQIRCHCHVYERIAHNEALSLMKRARVLLIPSIIDGIPNSLYEAMAIRAFPIVSPIDTIKSIVKDKKNVLFARNLYPEEISKALILAMNEDDLIDEAAINNLELVRSLADRDSIKKTVSQLYNNLQ